jgi:pimeloyl-ACP methyl ester carboxylesterase
MKKSGKKRILLIIFLGFILISICCVAGLWFGGDIFVEAIFGNDFFGEEYVDGNLFVNDENTNNADNQSQENNLTVYSDAIEWGDCPFSGDNSQLTCGYLYVPEDHDNLNGEEISLAFVVIESSTGKNTYPPLIYLEGGPGGSALDGMQPLWLNSPLLADRIIVLIDQRGTGYSLPSLNCTEYDDGILEDDSEITSACYKRLTEEGINLSVYNSAQSAADIASLRIALGYDEVDLLGISYGTRLALTVMRDYPEGIRRVILDSVYPPEANSLEDESLMFLQILEKMFDDCANNNGCNQAYPYMEEVFYETIEDLNNSPAIVSYEDDFGEYDELYYGDNVIAILKSVMYDTNVIPYLPAFIFALAGGDAQYAMEILEYPHEFGDLEEYIEYGIEETEIDMSDSEGMYNSVECGEEIFFNSISDTENSLAGYPSFLTEGLLYSAEDMIYYCQDWEVDHAESIENKRVISSIPTLLLNGGYDTGTFAPWAQSAAQGLSNGQYYEFPGFGHALIDAGTCPVSMMVSFLKHPNQKVNDSCWKKIGPPDFVIDLP